MGHNNINFGYLSTIQILSILLVIFLLFSACLVTSPYINNPPDLEKDYLTEKTMVDQLNGSSCSEKIYEAISGNDQFSPHQLNEPGARQSFYDPVFNTCMTRVTDHSGDNPQAGHTFGLKNEYSRVQSFNADGSVILVRGTDGSWYLYDAVSLQLLSEIPLDIDPRWDANDPSIIYYFSNAELHSFHIGTSIDTVIHDFSNDLPGGTPVMVWTRYEGSPTVDSRYWGLMVEDENWLTSAFLVYDLNEDQVVSIRDIRNWTDETREIDSVSISPLGTYFLAYHDKYCEPGQLGSDLDPCGLMVYDHNLENGRGLLRIIGHSDLALDENGREVLVYQDIDTDTISMLDLETGTVTQLLDIDFSKISVGLHFSGRAFQKPGYAVVSTYTSNPGTITWMDNQVFLVELKPNGRVIRLAFTRSLVDESQEHDYWAEPQASANQDLSRVVFTSNWGRSGSEEVDMYLIEIPASWLR